jgi:hypothetical protein
MNADRAERNAAMPSGSPCWTSYEIRTRHEHWQAQAITLLLLLLPPANAQELTASTVNGGGSLTSSGDVEITGSFGAFGDVTTGSGITARAGFPGQIYDPASIAISPGVALIAENSTTAFSALVVCDDETLLEPGDLTWSLSTPLLAVTRWGEVSAGPLPASFDALLTATTGGVSGTARIRAGDIAPDNFGIYASDGLPDAWQTLFFGLNNPDAAPSADIDADGQDNQTEYSAGTDPLDAASLLQLRFGPDPAPGTKSLIFAPFLPDRTYTLEWSAILAAPWNSLPDASVPASAPGEGQFIDASASSERKLYRLRITVP